MCVVCVSLLSLPTFCKYSNKHKCFFIRIHIVLSRRKPFVCISFLKENHLCASVPWRKTICVHQLLEGKPCVHQFLKENNVCICLWVMWYSENETMCAHIRYVSKRKPYWCTTCYFLWILYTLQPNELLSSYSFHFWLAENFMWVIGLT